MNGYLDIAVIGLLFMIPLGVCLAVFVHPAFFIIALIPVGLMCAAWWAFDKLVNGISDGDG